MPKETTALALLEEPDLALREEQYLSQRDEQDQRRAIGWDTGKLRADVHYKTYHYFEVEDGEERHGFEQYVTWDWKVSVTHYPRE